MKIVKPKYQPEANQQKSLFVSLTKKKKKSKQIKKKLLLNFFEIVTVRV